MKHILWRIEKRFLKIMAWLKNESPFVTQQVIRALIPILVKLGLKSLKDI